ncbi:MAG TPA: MarR family transcriptional regulator, partial [Ignavibacteriaceae bacterium]|nr:MarR family transcriptional regulator [Ignavibacteriaceae bacterium]
FEHAFRNNLELIKNNTRIAKQLKEKIKSSKSENLKPISQRMIEMEKFYLLMEDYYNDFLLSWAKERSKLFS